MKTYNTSHNFKEMLLKVLYIFPRGLIEHSTSLSDGNLVDGLPSARHSEVWAEREVFGPAPIGYFVKKTYEIEKNF